MPTVLYDRIGLRYAAYRQPDARIAARIADALAGARSVVNVGAGAGAYEPTERRVVAVEPAAEMIRQRGPSAAPAVQASAEALPFGDGSFDAAMAVLTIHHWRDARRGLAEMRRVARDRIVILTWDPEHPGFWLTRDYFPEILPTDRVTFPTLSGIEEVLGAVEVRRVPIPADCTDGFLGAYWRRPGAYLDPGARGAISAFAKLDDVEARIEQLRADLVDGTWARRNGDLLALGEIDLGYRLVISRL